MLINQQEVNMDRFKNFTVLINNISRNIKRIKSEEMKDFDLKTPHVSCIYYLYIENNLTAKELTDICDEDKAQISRSIDYLENNGYIICESTAKKRYRSNLYLTEKGKEVGKIICEKIDRILYEASVGLSEENRKIMYESLALINSNLANIIYKKGE